MSMHVPQTYSGNDIHTNGDRKIDAGSDPVLQILVILTIYVIEMVHQKWLHAHKDITIVEGVEWLEDFCKNVHDGDSVGEDKKYIDELEE
jgi:hypothetical protein